MLFLVLAAVRYFTFSGREYDGFTVTASRDAEETESLERININTADMETLQMIPGIGAELAVRIVAYRAENGFFQSVEDLLHVKGIGEQTLDRIQPYIVAENVP